MNQDNDMWEDSFLEEYYPQEHLEDEDKGGEMERLSLKQKKKNWRKRKLEENQGNMDSNQKDTDSDKDIGRT